MTAIYNTGLATVTNGSPVVTGTDTAWVTALVTGGDFRKGGLGVAIANVGGEGELTLVEPWAGPSGTGIYHIIRDNSTAALIVGLNDRLAQIIARMVAMGIPPSKIGTLTERDALSLGVEDDQFIFLRFEVLESILYVEFYRWDGTEWLGPFDPKGVGVDGADGVQSSDSSVTDIIALTQAEYDLLDPPDASTFYIIKPDA